MRMRLLAAGTRMPDWVDAGFDDYATRMRGDYRLELTEIPLGDRNSGDVRRAVEAEGKRMLAAAGDKPYRAACALARGSGARGGFPVLLHRGAGRPGR
jgi:23S rRNA (pseudouridine1915-N3)-methyltransferase